MGWLIGLLVVWVALLTWRVFRLEQAARAQATQRMAARQLLQTRPGREALRARLVSRLGQAG